MKIAGIDIGAETIKYVIVDGDLRREIDHGMVVHQKSVEPALRGVLDTLRAAGVGRIAVCGRFATHFTIRHYPG